MATEDFLIWLFCLVDDRLGGRPKHPQAQLWPSELVTIGLLFALKGSSFRSFYRWLERDYAAVFGGLPERTRLLRALRTHQTETQRFLADPTFFTVIDTYGIELIHPWRYGRSPRQVGRKGFSNHRWIVGLKLCARGEWNERMLIETVLSLVHRVCRLKYLWHRTWPYLQMHLAYVTALFNALLALNQQLDPGSSEEVRWPHIAQYAL